MQKEKHSSSWLGISVRWLVVHEHTYITESFVGLCTHSSVWKCLVQIEESVLLQVVCTGPLTCVAHFEVHKKKKKFVSFFCYVLRLGGGGLGRGFAWGFREGWCDVSSGLSQPSRKRCWAVWRSGIWCSGTVRSWKRLWEGWVGSFTILLALLEHRARKISRMEGRGAPMIFAAVFTVRWRVLQSAALGSRTRQWCSWSARSLWFPCRRWWGWMEGDLLFSAGGESVGAVVPSWRLTWCWWSRWGPLWCAPPGI